MDIAQIKFAEAYPEGEEPHPEFTWVSPELAIPVPSPVVVTVPSGGINRTTSTVSIASPASWTTLHAGGWPLPALRDNFSLCPGVLSIPKPIVPVVNDSPRYDAHTPQSCVVEYMDDPTLFESASPSTTAAISSVWTNMDKISDRAISRRPVRRLTLSTSAPWRCLDSDEPSFGIPPVGSRFHVSTPTPCSVANTSNPTSPIPDALSHSVPASPTSHSSRHSSIPDSANISPPSAASSSLRVTQSASPSYGPIIIITVDDSRLPYSTPH